VNVNTGLFGPEKPGIDIDRAAESEHVAHGARPEDETENRHEQPNDQRQQGADGDGDPGDGSRLWRQIAQPEALDGIVGGAFTRGWLHAEDTRDGTFGRHTGGAWRARASRRAGMYG